MAFQWLSRILWDRAYRDQPPWVSDGPDPLLVRLFDERRVTGPGRAIDLGCGSGEMAIDLARRGFATVGVDWSERAIVRARARAAATGVAIDFRVGDVTALQGVTGPFDLIVDRLVFMHMPGSRAKRAHASTVRLLAAPGAKALMHEVVLAEPPGFLSRAWFARRAGVSVLVPGDVERHFGKDFAVEVAHREPLTDTRRFRSARLEEVAYMLTRRAG